MQLYHCSIVLEKTAMKYGVFSYQLNCFGHQRFAVASTWNLVPESNDPELCLNIFRRQMKPYVFAKY